MPTVVTLGHLAPQSPLSPPPPSSHAIASGEPSKRAILALASLAVLNRQWRDGQLGLAEVGLAELGFPEEEVLGLGLAPAPS